MSAIKESSDELNPAAEVSAAPIAAVKKRRTLIDYVALAIATCGVGYFPIAPGTLGAMVGLALYLTIWSALYQVLESNAARWHLTLLHIFTPLMAAMMMVIVLVTIAGTWAATRAEKLMQRKDPSAVVIDEVAGQMIALLSGPFWAPTWWSVFTAFIFFRLFDIWKPYPIRRFEALESGLGIMADDLLAGIYALIVNSLLIAGYLLIFTPRT
jgi:phosphatidylglycerophosphatase A